jgi:hypothetical protein
MKRAIIFLTLFLSGLLNFSQAQNKINVGDTLGPWYVINFDNSSNYINIDTSIQNVWQIGSPQKIIFNSALSLPHAIITDTIHTYPANNYSYFDLLIGDFNFNGYYYGRTYIDFWHKYDTDTLKDGGYITVSWDKGLTWKNIIEDTISGMFTPADQFLTNLYTLNDTLFNGEHGFSGKSNGWVLASFLWQGLVAKNIPDTMILRFNFISDSINNNKEGWMIDNIRLYSIEQGGGVNELSDFHIIKISPNPFSSSTEILLDKNYKNIDLSVFDLQGKIIKEKIIKNCNKVNLDRAEIENGFYFLRIILDNKIMLTKKIIIE